MAKIARLRENAKVALRNIAIFWWDYLEGGRRHTESGFKEENNSKVHSVERCSLWCRDMENDPG